jgi:hypothetical protein
MVSIKPQQDKVNTRLTMGGYLYSELRIVK